MANQQLHKVWLDIVVTHVNEQEYLQTGFPLYEICTYPLTGKEYILAILDTPSTRIVNAC
jgi:hypothetical protein